MSYAFNHAEAARSFIMLPSLIAHAQCYWGFAYVLGPNYNGGMEPDNYQRAFNAVQKLLLVSNGTQKEKTLKHCPIRYVKESLEVRTALDSIYSIRMKAVYERYPDDPEIAALYAESIMDLHPWDLG